MVAKLPMECVFPIVVEKGGNAMRISTTEKGQVLLVSFLALHLFAGSSSAKNASRAGELIVEPPTLICLGFEWRIEGDDNHDASVQMRFRKRGDRTWRRGMPLCPIEYQTIGGSQGERLETPRTIRGFAGSLLDLDPETLYEVELKMVDPDGVVGNTDRKLTLKTRAEPQPFSDGEVRHVYPPEHDGEKQQPSYKSLMHAVNGYHTWCDEMQTVHPDAAPPGTVIKVHAGNYKIDRFHYREPTQLWLNGTYVFVPDGTAEKPIAIVAAGDGDVILDGDGCHTLFNVMAADHLYFEGLTIKNCRIAFQCGYQGVLGNKGLTVKNCRLENIAYGVHAQDARSENFYIADNTFIGSNPGDTFNPRSGGAWGKTDAGYAVNLSGAGHVVCYNHAANFWDGLNVFTGAIDDPYFEQQARAIDFYNNEVFNSTDNFIEADGGFTNIRILRNRCFNCMAVPLSVQPVYVGPVYWIRNVSFNAAGGRTAFKLASGSNVLAYHNTVTGHPTMHFCERVDYRNNAFLGAAGPGKDGEPRTVVHFAGGPGDVLTHNAHRVVPGEKVVFQVGSGEDAQHFHSIEEMAEKTGLGTESLVTPDYSVLAHAPEPDHTIHKKDSPLVSIQSVDLRPAPHSPLIDAGCVIPNVNDDFTGAAPDIGAYEIGTPIPHYGPRPTCTPPNHREAR